MDYFFVSKLLDVDDRVGVNADESLIQTLQEIKFIPIMNKYQLFQKAGDRLVFIIDRLFLPHYCLRDHILTGYI